MPNFKVGDLVKHKNYTTIFKILKTIGDDLYLIRVEIEGNSDRKVSDRPWPQYIYDTNWTLVDILAKQDKFNHHKKRVEERHIKNAARKVRIPNGLNTVFTSVRESNQWVYINANVFYVSSS